MVELMKQLYEIQGILAHQPATVLFLYIVHIYTLKWLLFSEHIKRTNFVFIL